MLILAESSDEFAYVPSLPRSITVVPLLPSLVIICTTFYVCKFPFPRSHTALPTTLCLATLSPTRAAGQEDGRELEEQSGFPGVRSVPHPSPPAPCP